MKNIEIPEKELINNMPNRRMPVTIITGFLGSGKTTLINQIIENRQGLRFAILVNEFGDINIDNQLLISLEEDMIELSNGCICCTINDGFVETIYRVLERQDPLDYLIIETTGIADPLPIILTLLGTGLRHLINIDAILTVVDSETFTPEHFDSQAALRQIIYGDIILLNKTDLVPEEKVRELENYIGTVKAEARILRSQYGQVPLPLILDIGLFQPDASSTEDDRDSHHLAKDGFVSVSFRSDRPFAVKKFLVFLQEKIPADVFRAKGILWFKESYRRHIFQLSGKRYNLKDEEWQGKPSNQLILIGRSLNQLQLYQQLNNCLTR